MTVKPVTAKELNILSGWMVNPHPDGQPWAKCCGTKGLTSCTCLTRKPIIGRSRLEGIIADGTHFQGPPLAEALKAGDRFFCVHRSTDDGFHRECAGWAKLKGKPNAEV
jgi:hypothetical protein